MSGSGEEFATALTELQQVAETLSQGADFFETQIKQGQPIAGVIESTKGYIKEVLQAATQHILNVADLVDGEVTGQTAAVCKLDNVCNTMLQTLICNQAKSEAQCLSVLQTAVPFQRFPKAFNPSAEA